MIEIGIYDHDIHQQRQRVLPSVPRLGELVRLREAPKGPLMVKTVVSVQWDVEQSSVVVSVTRDEARIARAMSR